MSSKKNRRLEPRYGSKGTSAQESNKKPTAVKSGSKYGAKKTEVNGILFDSRKEARVYRELHLQEMCGAILDLELQPRFLLQEAFEKNGEKYQKIEYIADFKYKELTGNIVIVDVKADKSFKTEVYRIKRKLFEYKYPDLTITEVY